MIHIHPSDNMGKIINCSIMNSNEEIKCGACEKSLLPREIYMAIETKDFNRGDNVTLSAMATNNILKDEEEKANERKKKKNKA